jgi:hypothetical protein
VPDNPQVRVTAEWAVWGKRPQGGTSSILTCSDGPLGPEAFTAILTRYSPGTPDELPQVTISWAGSAENAHIVMAIQNWSDEPDKAGRRSSVTRLFCVPYRQLARGPVSYDAMYEAFKHITLPVEGTLSVELDGMRPGKIAARLSEQAMTTAALLLTGNPVCIVQPDELPLEERLRHLNDVAAMLPYGLRSKLSAATWTSGTAVHRIRLAFAEIPRDGSLNVPWGRHAQLPQQASASWRYLEAIAAHARRDELVAKLARFVDPLDFGDTDTALAVLNESPRPSLPESGLSPADPDESGDVANVLYRCADALEANDPDAITELLAELILLSSRDFTAGQRKQFRRIMKRRGLLATPLPGDDKGRPVLYDALLRMAFGSALSDGDLDRIRDLTGGHVHPQLLRAVHRLPGTAPELRLRLVRELGGEVPERALAGILDADLVAIAARPDTDISMVARACAELVSRGEDGDDPALAAALREHGYLASALRRAYPRDVEAQHRALVQLLRAAHGPEFGPGEFREVLTAGPDTMPPPTLLTAAISRYGEGSRDLLVDAFLAGVIRDLGLAAPTRDGILAQLSATTPPPGGRSLPAHPPATPNAPVLGTTGPPRSGCGQSLLALVAIMWVVLVQIFG